MFSRSQSYSKRAGGPSNNAPNKLNKQRPSLDTGSVSNSFSANGSPSLAFSPVNVSHTAARPSLHLPRSSMSTTNLAIDPIQNPNASNSNLNVTSITPTSATSNPTTPSSGTSALPMLPSIRSFRNRFPFGNRSSSHKKDRQSISTAVDIITGEDDVLEIGAEPGDRSLDPAALRSSSTSPHSPFSLLPPDIHDPVTLPRMQSQPNLATKKRKSFDFAGLSARPSMPIVANPIPAVAARSKSPDNAIGLGRPQFATAKLVKINGPGRSFTPGGTAIREAVSEADGEDLGQVVFAAAEAVTALDGPTPTQASIKSHRSPLPSTLPEIAENDGPRRSTSMDSSTAPDSANITRVIDLSMASPPVSVVVSPSPSMPIPQDAPLTEGDMNTLLRALDQSLAAQSGSPSPEGAKWTLQDMKGAVLRMKSLVADGQKLDSSPASFSLPTSATTASLAVAATITPSPTTGPGAMLTGSPALPSEAARMLSPETINADASFASSHIDVDAIEEALEERLAKEFVGNILEADTSLEESPKSQAKSSTGPSLRTDEAPDLETLDPNLAALLSPNNLLALPSTTTSTPMKVRAGAGVSPRQQPISLNASRNKRFRLSAEDLTFTPGTAHPARERSGSEAMLSTTAARPPMTPLNIPITLNGRSRSHTPTPAQSSQPEGFFTPTKRDSTSSQVSSSSSVASPAYSATTSTSRGTSTFRRAAPPPLPITIPSPLPPPQISPEDTAFPTARRMTVTTNPTETMSSPASPAPRKRAISSEGPSPEKPSTLRSALANPARALSPQLPNGKGRATLEWSAGVGRNLFDRYPPRPASSTTFHRKLRTDSPERLGQSSSAIPPRSMTSFSFSRNTPVRPTPDHPLPPVAGGHQVRKRRSYSIDHAGDRTRFFASLGYRGGRGVNSPDDEEQRGPLSVGRPSFDSSAADSATGSRADALGPLTKKAFAAAGLLTTEPRVPGSRSYGGPGWKDIRNPQQQDQADETITRPTLSRASTLADLMPSTTRHFSKDSISTAEHPSTPSSASGPSRTLYAPSTTSSGHGNSANGRTSTPSPVTSNTYLPTITVSSHTETVSLLKERHELEKDALLSALADMKRQKERVQKEKDDLAAYVTELEERLAAAEELNQKMEGLRMAVMEVAGGLGRKASDRRPGQAEASSSTSKPKIVRRPRTADSVTESPPRTRIARDPSPAANNFLSARKEKEVHRRSGTSEASMLLPVMKSSREMSMLLNERPPIQYAPSSVASNSRPGSPADNFLPRRAPPETSPTAPSFSFYQQSESSGGSLKLRLEDELHLADLVSMGPVSDDERDDAESVF